MMRIYYTVTVIQIFLCFFLNKNPLVETKGLPVINHMSMNPTKKASSACELG